MKPVWYKKCKVSGCDRIQRKEGACYQHSDMPASFQRKREELIRKALGL